MQKGQTLSAFQRAIAIQAYRSQHRIERFEWRGQAVWIKRFHVSERARGKRLHELMSRLFPLSFLLASHQVDGEGMAERERRKLAAFARAGIAVPELVWFDRTTIALADAGPTIESLLRNPPAGWDDRMHAALAALTAEELGRVHAAGLCHGRPHPRDMAVRDGRVVFFDFEEEPEAVMPLADAQARDAWLLFLQLVARSRSRGATVSALQAYQDFAPAGAQDRLRRIALVLRLPARLCFSFRLDRLGSDLRRFAGATLFLAAALASPDMPLGPGMAASPTAPILRKSTEARTDDSASEEANGGDGALP